MDIVIGFQGKEHITASQVGRILAGMAGEGVYVLATQNQLAATMQTANQVRIDTGDLVMHGRVATVETPETLTVESGATGQKRNDLVVARYQKDASSSVESIQLVVVKGTPVSYGDPSDPQINGGSVLDGDSPVDVPLWRIPIDGLAPGAPVKLFETAPSADGLRDSVSQAQNTANAAQNGVNSMPKIKYGVATSIGGVANKTVYRHVNLSGFSQVPSVAVCPQSTAPNTCAAAASNVTTSGFDIRLYRTNTANTDVFWIAIGV